MGGAVSAVTNTVKNVGKAASGAVGNVQKGVQQFGKGAQQLGSGDLRGLQTMGGSLVNTGSGLVGNSADLTRASIDALYGAPGMGMLKGTPLDGMIRGNLKGAVGSAEGLIRGNIAGIQDLPTDIGAGVQHGADQIGAGVQHGLDQYIGVGKDLYEGLGNALGGLGNALGGGGGGGAGGGVSAPRYYKDLAKKQAEYGLNLPDEFQQYEGDRFVEPSQLTSRGEGILGGRYDSRFGEGGTDPFAAANAAVGSAANYTSGFQGTTDGIGGQAGNYQANLANASNPGVFQSRDYTTGLPNFENTVNLNAGDFQNVVNPTATSYGNTNQGMTGTEFGNVNQAVTGRSYQNANANQTNVNANLTNPLEGLEPVTFESANQGLASSTYGNANQGLQGPQDYNRGFQGLLNQSFNPFQDQVVNQTIQDLDRARRISENDIRGQAAKAGAFGSREELLRAENNRNYLDRVAAATGQLRSQGFESAANRASQENLQRLGLTASDVQNVRGLQSQGNLQGQSLSAAADQQLRGLQSQGNLQAQNLTASDRASARDLAGRGALQTQALQSQGGLQAQNLQAQGAQAAQGLTAQSDRQTQALQSQGALAGQQLTAQDAQQVRSLISQGGLQGQNLTAADRQQLNDLVSRGALQSQNLSAADRQQLNSLITQGALQSQNLNANLLNQALGLNAGMDRAALQANAGLLSDAMGLDAADLQQRRNLASTEAQFAENALRNAGALNLSGGQALGQLAQAGTADERQRIADMLAAGQAGDMRGQQQADFDYQQFVDETQRFPTQYLNNLQQSGGLAQSLISGPQPQQNPNSGLLNAAGMGLGTYGMLAGIPAAAPYALPAALGMGALGLLGG